MKIIDNFLPERNFADLQKIILSEKFPWFYIEHASLAPEDNNIKDPMSMETSGFYHSIYEREWDVKSFTYEYFYSFFKMLEDNFGIREQSIIRARLSMKTPKVGYTKDNYNLPHVDYYVPHDTLIFYLNNSDGNTRIFDQKYNMTGSNTGFGYDTFTIRDQVAPVANRLLWIDGLQYHTASNPIESNRRVILNINLEPL